MQYSSILTAAVALLYATSASAKCFQTGQNWGDHGVAKSELAKACRELSGKYNPYQKATRCRNSGGNSYKFEIENTTGADQNISQGECTSNVGAQIDNCGHGGEIVTGGIRYRGDPNAGLC